MSKLNLVPTIILMVAGIAMIVLGFIRQTSALNENYLLFGMMILLFCLHLFNSKDINKLEKEVEKLKWINYKK